MRIRNPIQLGQNLFGFGFLWFGSAVTWFAPDTYGARPGVFSPLTPGFANVVLRAEFVVSAAMAAAGVLVRRSAFRKLSLADYIFVLASATVPVLVVFKMYASVR